MQQPPSIACSPFFSYCSGDVCVCVSEGEREGTETYFIDENGNKKSAVLYLLFSFSFFFPYFYDPLHSNPAICKSNQDNHNLFISSISLSPSVSITPFILVHPFSELHLSQGRERGMNYNTAWITRYFSCASKDVRYFSSFLLQVQLCLH